MTVNAGTLALSGGNDRLSTSGAITVINSKLDLGGNSQTTAGAVVFDNAVVTNGTITKSVAAYDARSGTISASLGGAVGLTKTTTGTLILSGANTYTGNTFLNGGTTLINGGTISGPGYMDVGAYNNPATLIFNSGSITAGSQFVIGAHGTSSGIQSNGTLQVNAPFYIGGYGDGAGVGTYTQVGGTVTVTGGINFNGGGPNSGVYNLSGGTLTVNIVTKNGGAGAGTFNFNGGVLKPRASSTTFMQGLTAANVQLGGARFDTAGFDIAVGQPLLHEPSLGATLDGGLAKLGAGVLTLSGKNSYNGTTVISNGTLRLGVANAITNTGSVRVEGGIYDLNGFIVTNGTVTLNSGSIINGSLNASSFTLSDSGTLLANLDGGTLTKMGSGNAILYGGNTCTGETSVTQGTLTLAKLGLANCRLHLDASDITTLAANSDGTGEITGAGQQVGYWKDLSGNNKPATQATSSRRPTYITNVAEFNGQPVLQFDGSDDDITSLLDINATNIPNMTVIMIFRQVTYKTNGGVWGHDDGAWDRLQLLNFGGTGNNNIAGNNNSILVKGMNTNAVMLYAAVLKNGVANSSYVYINSVSDGNSGLPAFTSQENSPYGRNEITFGNINAGGGYRGNIQIGEVLVFDTALTAPARRNVETYLKNKWLGASDPFTPFLPTNGAVQVASGAVLNLDGASHTVASVSGEGVVSNGALVVTGTISPAGEAIGTLKLSNVALNGTLRVNVAMDGSSDQLVSTGNLSLSGLTLQIADTGLLNWQKSYTLVTCSGSLTGEFTTALPQNWKIKYDRTAGTATLVYIPPGTMVRFM
jgi:autotransporter-associated beta strand protein